MPSNAPPSTHRIAELVMANRAIRAPYYDSSVEDGVEFTDPDKGLQWGADVIPALLGLFRVEPDLHEDHLDGWVGFARHWRGGTLRIAFDLVSETDEPDPILAVNSIEARVGEATFVDEDYGEIELPDQIPTAEEWEERDNQYHAARSKDTTDGAAGVTAYIQALPGWKHEIASRFDEIIDQQVPKVRRAVRYHQPFYGIEDEGWFASFGAFSKHVKLTFVCDSPLDPQPPSGTGPHRQALDLQETDAMDEEQIASWIRQAAADPGMGW